ncbi:ABC transporter ATP-binding protein [Ideonella sp. DXS29W]|uniref:ABC transporter ATP-binding protein n=1 Tax=Ideonella lacteola TaxID=2984193 RepID=A0ABU9BLW6_9BURK
MSLLETRQLDLWAGEQHLVKGLNWAVQEGERWCLIGRNAVGKSSLLRALAGLSVAGRAGEVRWHRRPQQEWPAAEAACWRAWMPQQPADRFALPVRRLLALSVVQPEGARDLDVELQGLDIQHLRDRVSTRLSGGERQRVAIAQAAVQGAPLLLLDEPIAFQDPAHQGIVARWAADWASRRPGRALVMSSHDMHWVARAATHVLALMGDGQWRAGPVDEMLQAAPLREIFGCEWMPAGGSWLPV